MTSRCKRWVAACNRPYLAKKTVDQLKKNFKICSAHFVESDFINDKMCRLKPTAVPKSEIGLCSFNCSMYNNFSIKCDVYQYMCICLFFPYFRIIN